MSGCLARGRGDRGHPVDGGDRGDRGTVTAELAVALPALVLVLSAVLAAGRVAVAQLQCIDAARAAARFAARGEPAGRSASEANRVGPPGSSVEIGAEGSSVTVRVSVPVSLLGRHVTVDAVAAAEREQP